MVELVDTRDLKSLSCEGVPVRFRPPVPFFMNAEEQIEKLGLELPPAPKPGGVYQPLLIHDGLAYVSGHGPLLPD